MPDKRRKGTPSSGDENVNAVDEPTTKDIDRDGGVDSGASAPRERPHERRDQPGNKRTKEERPPHAEGTGANKAPTDAPTTNGSED